MKFPANLTPWAKHLQIFPDEISLILGNYAQKISPFITPLNFTAEDESGEPNGYDGVARRGIYERLLLSELALADDFSDEFVRRAVMGEHLFLNLSKVSPGTKRISIALFDTGAMQIGTPRIAHLAAFIVLARRAEAAGAMFLWGVLQDVKQLVISDDTEASIKILLESRKSADVVDADISEWREKLKDLDKTSDVWLIGSENLARFDELNKFSHLYIEEGLELDKRELHLKIICIKCSKQKLLSQKLNCLQKFPAHLAVALRLMQRNPVCEPGRLHMMPAARCWHWLCRRGGRGRRRGCFAQSGRTGRGSGRNGQRFGARRGCCGRWVGACPAQHRLDARLELSHTEWLGQVIVGTCAEPIHHIGVGAFGGEHNNRHT